MPILIVALGILSSMSKRSLAAQEVVKLIEGEEVVVPVPCDVMHVS